MTTEKSNTPRTDAALKSFYAPPYNFRFCDLVDFARQLERELAASHRICQSLEQFANKDIADLRRELAEATKQLSQSRQDHRNAVATVVEIGRSLVEVKEQLAEATKQRDEAREFLREAIKCYVEPMSWPMREDIAAWRAAAGLEGGK